MKSSELGEIENQVTVPKVAKNKTPLIGMGGNLSVISSKLGGKVKKNEVELERKRSNERFKEMQINGMTMHLLNAKGVFVETTSKMCGDDEYMFTTIEGTLRIWKGGISVFDDGSKDILFHKPHMVIDFKQDNYAVVSDIHNFELIPFMRILNAMGIIEKIFGTDE